MNFSKKSTKNQKLILQLTEEQNNLMVLLQKTKLNLKKIEKKVSQLEDIKNSQVTSKDISKKL